MYREIISTSVRFLADTEVDLIRMNYFDHRVVMSCGAEGTHFVLTIRLNTEYPAPQRPSDRDPGVLAADNFLTEEDELRILAEVEAELAEQKHPPDPPRSC